MRGKFGAFDELVFIRGMVELSKTSVLLYFVILTLYSDIFD